MRRIGRQTLHLGDCLDHLHRCPDRYDGVITSPPYNLGIDYHAYEDNRTRDDYLKWMDRVLSAIGRRLTPDGSLFLNVGSSLVDPWIALDVAQVARSHFVLQNHIVWVKSICIGEKGIGHYKPINSTRFLNHNFEHLLHLTPNGTSPVDRLAIGIPYQDKSNLTRGTRGKHGDRRCAGNVWFVPYRTIQRKAEKGSHPAIFPPELVRRCLLLLSPTAETAILDPFCGTGTTLQVCEELGCQGVGIELDPLYFDHAVRKLEEQIHGKERRKRTGPPEGEVGHA